MALRSLGAFALASASAASAFQDTSPFFLFSNAARLPPFDNGSPQLLQARTLEAYLEQSVKDCATVPSPQNYILVHQEGVSASDYQDGTSTPYLSGWLSGKDAHIQQRLIVPEVVGVVDGPTIQQSIHSSCAGTLESFSEKMLSDSRGQNKLKREDKAPRIISLSFPALPLQEPAEKLAYYDSLLGEFINDNMINEEWTVLYTTTPRDERVVEGLATQTYEMDAPFPDAVNIELKRDIESHAKDRILEGGLFEKYMFLSPGIFMGLTAAVPLVLILYVGISAISGLEVSYFAFSKEMGPAGQKKQ